MIFGIYIFLVGLCIGSFLNVCIYRIPEDISIVAPRSRCGSCETVLKPLDLIPLLSYAFLGGKCRYCGERISLRYPLVELVTGLLFLLAYLQFGMTITMVESMCFIALLITVFFIDFDHMIIPNELVALGIVIGLAINVYLWIGGQYTMFFLSSKSSGIIGALVGSGILLLISIISSLIYGGQSAIGMGDVKLFVVIGLFLGWELTLLTLWLSFIIGGIIGVVLIFIFKMDRKAAIPFGPFIVTAAFVSMFVGSKLIFMLFGI